MQCTRPLPPLHHYYQCSMSIMPSAIPRTCWSNLELHLFFRVCNWRTRHLLNAKLPASVDDYWKWNVTISIWCLSPMRVLRAHFPHQHKAKINTANWMSERCHAALVGSRRTTHRVDRRKMITTWGKLLRTNRYWWKIAVERVGCTGQQHFNAGWNWKFGVWSTRCFWHLAVGFNRQRARAYIENSADFYFAHLLRSAFMVWCGVAWHSMA